MKGEVNAPGPTSTPTPTATPVPPPTAVGIGSARRCHPGLGDHHSWTHIDAHCVGDASPNSHGGMSTGCHKLGSGDRRELKGWGTAVSRSILTQPPRD